MRAICPRHFVIRTCGLYGVWGAGGKGGNFVETMLRLAGQGKPLRVVDDQTCTPTYTADLAAAAAALTATGGTASTISPIPAPVPGTSSRRRSLKRRG